MCICTYFVYITKTELLVDYTINPTLMLVLTYEMNYAKSLGEFCGYASVKYRITHPRHVHMVASLMNAAVFHALTPTHTHTQYKIHV